MSEATETREEHIERLRAELAELESAQEEVIEEAVEEAVEEVEETALEAAEEVAEEIEDATGEPVEQDERELLAAIIADRIVERLAPALNPVPAVTEDEVAEAVVEEPPEVVAVEPVEPDLPPVNPHWSHRRLWGR